MIGEHDTEPLPGLPACLPEGERLLWQGSPDFSALARRALHVNKVAVYFAAIVVWRLATQWNDAGFSYGSALFWPLMLSAVGLGLLVLLAYLHAKCTIYTITNKRVVLRFGIAVSMTLNLPFSKIASAKLKKAAKSGDIALQLVDTNRVSYLVLWPNVRPWRWAEPQPVLRCLADADEAAKVLCDAVDEYGLTQTDDAPVPAPAHDEVVNSPEPVAA